VQVNGKLQTSNPDIYTIGDVAAFHLKIYGLDKMFQQRWPYSPLLQYCRAGHS